MVVQATEISRLLKEQIAGFQDQATITNVGQVVEVGDGIARAYGLSQVMAGELVEFTKNGTLGLAFNLEEDSVGVIIMGEYTDIEEGDEVRSTGRIASVPVGPALVGRVVNALGQPIDGKGPINAENSRPIERIAPGVVLRQDVDTPLQTGLKSIDSMIPIGRGQRELIIGDRQTGKSAVVLDTIINQRGTDVTCIYVAIGQRMSTVVGVAETLDEHGALDNTIIVAAPADEAAPIKFMAPYSGCTMGEYFRDRGEDALIVYDDLSKQAVAYR